MAVNAKGSTDPPLAWDSRIDTPQVAMALGKSVAWIICLLPLCRQKRMHNLLSDRFIRVRSAGRGAEQLSLPEVYEVLAADQLESFIGLRPHQKHAWHAFLAQLAVIALHNCTHHKSPIELSAEEWGDALRGLTTEYDDEPWKLVVGDPKCPAFMQPPSMNGFEDYKKHVFAPDDLDILVTAKNHELKQSIAMRHSLDDWVYALVSLQTMAPFSGRGNYGIARMKGGYSSRPCLSLRPRKGGLGAHLFHDIDHMIANRDQVLQNYPEYYRVEGGLSLLWTEPWDGSSSFTLDNLDPHFIEICRRVRLFCKSASIVARTGTSSKPRITASHANGNLGDHWTPVDVKRGWSLSMSQSRLQYEKLTELLIGNTFHLPNAMKVKTANGESWKLTIRGLAGGQGKTEGYHERSDLAFSNKTSMAFGFHSSEDELAVLVEKQLDEISSIANALRNGIAVAASGKREPEKQDWQRASSYLARFHREVDSFFFRYLDRRFVADTNVEKEEIRAEFGVQLVRTAREVFQLAVHTIPCSVSVRHRAQALAEMTFNARLRKSAFNDRPEVLHYQNP